MEETGVPGGNHRPTAFRLLGTEPSVQYRLDVYRTKVRDNYRSGAGVNGQLVTMKTLACLPEIHFPEVGSVIPRRWGPSAGQV